MKILVNKKIVDSIYVIEIATEPNVEELKYFATFGEPHVSVVSNLNHEAFKKIYTDSPIVIKHKDMVECIQIKNEVIQKIKDLMVALLAKDLNFEGTEELEF